ncbi:hypothetical protein NQ315_002493 [Exocentrus adspersus]|uniref:Reverse transcriptase domain-containing protein n=1 Tax=Exocentrus adspersus TaxID=1586481 RepID=A0AAV8VLG6_9CUCU|nr:hypothetical protein NQ315_002493 [Exocentrus adspersus]
MISPVTSQTDETIIAANALLSFAQGAFSQNLGRGAQTNAAHILTDVLNLNGVETDATCLAPDTNPLRGVEQPLEGATEPRSAGVQTVNSLLWSLLVDDLLAILIAWEVEVQAYADDLVILVRGTSEELVSSTLQEVLDGVMSWCELEQMSTNIMEHNRMLEGIESHSVLGMVSDGLPVRINLDLPYNVLLPGRDEWERNKTDLLRADSCWYTDGSKTPEGVGAGVYSRRPRVEIADSLGQYATVFQAEIHAIELCGRELNWPKTSHAQNRPSGTECRLCMEDDETAEHVLCTCSAADRTRFSILGKVQLMPEDLDKYSPGKIIDFLRRLELLGEV